MEDVNDMSFVYVAEDGSKIGLEGGTITVLQKNGEVVKIPKETVEGISIFGNSQVTTQCVQYCLRKGIRISFFSKVGFYYGCMLSTGHVNIKRLKQQIFLSENQDFCLKLSQKLIEAKINNQLVVVKRYLRTAGITDEESLFQIRNAKKKVLETEDIEQLMGYEGIASRSYFKIIASLVDEQFRFEGRNRRPPKDPFNSMLSLGYTLVMYEIYGEIENRGLNPYAGFLHQDRERHPTLASDLMEEWRPVLIDAVVLSLIQGHEIQQDHFYYDKDTGACFLTENGMKIFFRKLENKLHSEMRYLEYIKQRTSFRRAIWHQVGLLVKAIESNDVDEYIPLRIR